MLDPTLEWVGFSYACGNLCQEQRAAVPGLRGADTSHPSPEQPAPAGTPIQGVDWVQDSDGGSCFLNVNYTPGSIQSTLWVSAHLFHTAVL